MRLLLLLLAPLAFGQTPLFPTKSESALVDAVVTDAQGQPVANLTAADFEVLRNGRPQKVHSAEFSKEESTVLFLIDDLNLTCDAMAQVRAALAKFQPGDHAIVIRTSATNGKSEAVDALTCYPARVAGGLDSVTPKGLAAGARSAIELAVGGLRQLSGRKTVVIFSGNLAMYRDAIESAGRLVTLANQAGAVLYGVDPHPGGDPATGAAFAVLAEKTGGALLQSLAALPPDAGYYLIAFDPDVTLTAPAGDLEVRAKREGLHVRSRTGSIVKPHELTSLSELPRRTQLLRGLSDPFTTGEIGASVTPIFTNTAQGSVVEVLTYIDARDIGFVNLLSGSHRYSLDVILLISNADQRIVAENSRSVFGELSDADYRHAISHGLLFVLNLALSQPGPYHVRSLIGDGSSGKIGSASQFLEVPDAAGKQFCLSSLMVMGERVASPLSKPAGIQLGLTADNPAIRTFHPGQAITYGYEVVNPTIGAGKKVSIEAQVRLFRNGSMVFEGEAKPIEISAGEDPKRHFVGGKITLASSMQPGTYVVEVIAVDKVASLTVARSTDFRLVP